MKKLTLILALISNLCNAQTDQIKILSVTDTVNVNDSITIKFTKKNISGSNGMSRIQLWTSSYLQDCLYTSSMFLLDTNIVKIKITSLMGTGNARLYTNVGPYTSFYIRSTVGVQEHCKSQTASVQYYDIYGKEKSLAETKDLTIKITTYSNGYQYKEKIIPLTY